MDSADTGHFNERCKHATQTIIFFAGEKIHVQLPPKRHCEYIRGCSDAVEATIYKELPMLERLVDAQVWHECR